jgi:nucleoside-diphosphate-sugar epimerase
VTTSTSIGTSDHAGPLHVVVAGADTLLGQRVVQRLGASGSVDVTPAPAGGTVLADALSDVDTVVLLGPLGGPDIDGTGGSVIDLAASRRLLDAAGDAGVRHVVVLSTAMVYGAWPDNPVPITEDAPLRPDVVPVAVVERAELERMVAAWCDEQADRRAAVLRPVVVVAPDRTDWFRRSPWRSSGIEVGEDEPPHQFLHVDDLVSAIEVATRQRLDGPFNVAPDGWLAVDSWRELGGPRPRLRIPRLAATRLTGLRFRLGISQVPPDVLSYVTQPWVVANDRLCRAGWQPAYSNEEAYVVADRAGPLRAMNPRVRQELSLAAVGAIVALAVAGVILVLRRRRR